MAYIGNTVQNQGFAPAVDYFNGDGTTVTFTLSRPVASVAQLTAVIENVIQNPSTAFTVSGSSITFTSAPPSGTNNIWVEYTSLITTYAALSQDPTVIGDITATGGYLATGDFGNTYVDGTIVDYVTGMSRITTGPSDGVTIYNGGTSARSALMTISSAGNVGIGTSSPNSKLEVNKAITFSNIDDFAQLVVKSASGATGKLLNIGVDDTNNLSFIQSVNRGIDANNLVLQRYSGNVGIGTSSPAAKLHVNGSVRLPDSYEVGFGSANSTYWLGDSTNNWHRFYTNNSERMRIDSSGRLLVGLTSLPVSSAKINIGFNNNSGSYALNVYHQSSSYNDSALVFYSHSNSVMGYIYCNGSSTQYATSSDYRLKENIAPMTGALAKVAQLKPCTYTWKETGRSSEGFIAHELQEVVPDCVTGEKDAVNEDGSIKAQGIDTSFLVATLTAAIQEQQEIINDLKARIETLESK